MDPFSGQIITSKPLKHQLKVKFPHSRPEPYEDPSIWAVNTIHIVGIPITFLAYQQSLNEDRWEITLYAIEAPVICPRRVAFESSKLSWLDFWLERKRESLEHWLETSSWNGQCPKKCEKNYRDFVTRNAMRLPKNAA